MKQKPAENSTLPQMPQGGFGPCEEQGSFDSAFLGESF